MIRQAIRQIVLGTVSVLALGIGGFVLDYAANAGTPVSAAPSVSYAADSSQADGDRPSEDARWVEQQLRKDNIRWAQVELRTRGLYRGSLDGVLGPQTKQALRLFQRDNGLSESASLDARTWEALTDETSIGVGSSMPPDARKARETTDAPPASHLGR
jgi:cobalt/nickel transport protein